MKQITFDHLQPLSKGGMDDLPNYRLAHLNCNHLKADMELEDFIEFQKGEIKYEN